MTVQELIKQKFVECGLWPEEADIVIELAKKDEVISKNFRNRWNDTSDGYSAKLFVWLMYGVSRIAVQWIDDNKPEHFAWAILAPHSGARIAGDESATANDHEHSHSE